MSSSGQFCLDLQIPGVFLVLHTEEIFKLLEAASLTLVLGRVVNRERFSSPAFKPCAEFTGHEV